MKIGTLEIPESCLYAARAHMLNVRQFTQAEITRLVQVPYGRRRTPPQQDWLRKQIGAKLLDDLIGEGKVVRAEAPGCDGSFRHVLADPKPAMSFSARQAARAPAPYQPRRKY